MVAIMRLCTTSQCMPHASVDLLLTEPRYFLNQNQLIKDGKLSGAHEINLKSVMIGKYVTSTPSAQRVLVLIIP